MKQKIKYQILMVIAMVVVATVVPMRATVQASGCPDVRVLFVRGSGGERWVDKNYLEYKSTIEERLKTVSLSYEFIDLEYPAVPVGIDNLLVTLGAYFGRGEAYEFGESVRQGVENLIQLVNTECPNTKYVLGGYSQGAMVISRAIRNLKADKVIYVATFGDPKIYLPEGKGIFPKACRGKGLSDYRMYVPDCHAYKGKLGANQPYAPEGFAGKVGTWCNGRDFFCSSGANMSDHTNYIGKSLYQDAAKVIFSRICQEFGIKARVATSRDTAILIDSTWSMSAMIDMYKVEALRLARETFEAGGRVALYDYRDLLDQYEPVEHCNFETCTLEVFTAAINAIQVDGGGDWEESLLSASFYAMKNLKWTFGATKSIVVLTDAPFLLPDRDGVTLDEVVRLSKEIDPVNFYIITEEGVAPSYEELAGRTDGIVMTNMGELGLLTDYIMNRFDSLPRVEEDESMVEKPSIEVISSELIADGEHEVKFNTDAEKIAVVLNDWIVGVTYEDKVVVSGLDLGMENRLTLIPIRGEMSGDSVEVLISAGVGFGAMSLGVAEDAVGIEAPMFIPKAPNTGRR